MVGKIITISGPTQVGKDTLLNGLERDSRFEVIRTCTTRAKRSGEIEGQDYYFISEDLFHQKVLNGQFIEWDYILHNYYGILKDTFHPVEHKTLVIACLSRIALRLQARFEWIVPVFLFPKDIDQVKRRIKEQFKSDDIIQERYFHLEEELRHSAMFKHICIADSKIDTLNRVMNLLKLL